jgi:hypothetical protein
MHPSEDCPSPERLDGVASARGATQRYEKFSRISKMLFLENT